MKKILTIIAAASIFAACNSKSDLDTNKDVIVTDTTNMYRSNASTDINSAQQPKEEVKTVAPAKIIRETRIVYVDRIPKVTKKVVHQAAPVESVVITPQQQPQTNTTQTNSNGTSDKSGNGTTASTGNGTNTSSTTPAQKDKGWSNAAKDAVIGGVGGAVVGAVISKKKGTGAVIGGILGAAGGYILGKKKDKAGQTADAKYTSY